MMFSPPGRAGVVRAPQRLADALPAPNQLRTDTRLLASSQPVLVSPAKPRNPGSTISSVQPTTSLLQPGARRDPSSLSVGDSSTSQSERSHSQSQGVQEPQDSVQRQQHRKPYSGTHVLVVDDDTTTRRVMARLIMRLMPGCTVSTASDGAAAVRHVQEAAVPPQYITMDNQMPAMTGQEATAALRAWGYRGRIVGVTGNAVGGDGEAFVSAGADAVVFKPSTAGKLAEGLQVQHICDLT